MADAPTVPVFIDSTRPSGNARYARCTYFCIDCQIPQTDWSLLLGTGSIPIILLGMSCIIVSPLEGGFFTHPRQIEHLFDLIEQTDGLVLEVNDVLIPARSMPTLGERDARGAVLRAEIGFFRSAFAFRSSRLSEEDYFRQTTGAEQPLVFSAEETRTFRAWEENVIAEAKRYYREHRDQALQWKGRDDDPGASAQKRPPPPDLPPPPDWGNPPFSPAIPPRRPVRQGEGLGVGEYA
ncbi:MAG TPA: hypothetical protein VGM64_09750 [Lacunisphaera sp.]|jgi:hypothetical protein